MATRVYRVIGYATKASDDDVEVKVNATSPQAAEDAALKKNPRLAEMSDVRVFTRSGVHWVRRGT